MSNVIDTLVEMGFSRRRAELAVEKTKSNSITEVTEWLLTNEETEQPQVELEPAPLVNEVIENLHGAATSSEETATAKSLKCDDCGKLFKNQTEVEFHAAKSGHDNFSESTEEKKPLTEDEKKEQLAKIEAKLRQRRLEREEKEKLEALEREKKRIRSGKEMLEAKKKHEDLEIKKIVEQRKREKEEERIAKQRVMKQIEQDKLARKAKFSNSPTTVEVENKAPTTSVPKPVAHNYTEVKLQIRLTDGNTMIQSFGAKEPLSAVRVYIEMNRSDEPGSFSLMTNYPKKIFNGDDYEKPLDLLGLAPTAVLIVKKI
ncbi:PREDICTED: UBX domain-containing protein 1-like [Nicrophorus vespilloides]|uniref:UBX domain-containing protein 1-like n=1 Tax=Nicrophorus vespilloides TaxID=110193 RepID=A0ABM1M8H2_NICVS|nr:PREDICTED: UBX domain-containing protein 1-like [Nicrophorus vespilloides]XP_017770872.1 PREDICTED: UBX domain-containing protein 1-like [Nicrophorus vespilloides]